MAELEEIIEQPSESQQRITQLSGKVKTETEAKEKALAEKAEAEKKAADAERKAAFLDGFSDILAENPAAKEFKADMEAKVMSGMSLEDAKFAVLGKAGKLGQPQVETMSPAGGSASTAVIGSSGEKSIGEMTQEERRAALMEREGELHEILAPKVGR